MRGILMCMRWMTLLLALTLMGCATSDLAALETKAANLEAEVVNLQEDRRYLCAVTIEMTTDGMAQYLGGISFRHALSGEVIELEFEETCIEYLDGYRQEVEERVIEEEPPPMLPPSMVLPVE